MRDTFSFYFKELLICLFGGVQLAKNADLDKYANSVNFFQFQI